MSARAERDAWTQPKASADPGQGLWHRRPPPWEDRVLSLPARQHILRYVSQNPGVSFAQIAASCEITPSTLRYHLSMLERYRYIIPIKTKGKLHYGVPDADLDRVVRNVLSRDPGISRILKHIMPAPQPARVLARMLQHELGLSRSGSWHVIQRAHEAQLVRKEWRQGGLYIVKD